MNKTMALSHVFVFVGVVLVLGSVVAVPYTQNEWVEVEKTRTWKNETFTLYPNDRKLYDLDFVWENESIICINAQTETAPNVVLKIARLLNVEPVFETMVYNISWGGQKVFWTPPYGIGWFFIFEDQGTTEATVSVKITIYWPRAHEVREVTHYNQVLDQVFAYPGVVAIIVGFALKPGKAKQKREDVSYDYDERWVR